MKLYSDDGNFQTLKLLIASNISGVKLDYQKVNSDEKVTPYLERHKLPVLEVTPGRFLFSANSAARLLLVKAGHNDSDVMLDQWLEWESTELVPVVVPYLVGSLCQKKTDKDLTKQICSLMTAVNTALNDRSHFVGTKSSIADVVIWSTLYPVLAYNLIDKDWQTKYNNVAKWFTALNTESAFQQAVSKVTGSKGADSFKVSLSSQPVPLPPVTMVTKAGKAAPASRQTSAGSGPPSADSSVTAEGSEEKAFSQEEINESYNAWINGHKNAKKIMERKHPVLPLEGRKNILITSALPYVNNVPHLGNIIGCVLSADVYSRFCRLRNYNSLYICGTDEYGTATETKAAEEGLTPQQICEKYNKLHTEIYEWFNIDFDYFGRTTTQKQTEIAQEIFWKLYKNNHILKDSVEQLKCEQCDRFLADRFVEGTCPLCKFEDARGDQCDSCGKLLNAADLKEPKCKLCKNTPVVKTSDHLFLDLPKLDGHLSSYLEKQFDSGLWSSNTKVITRAWLRDGLKPRCISRDLKWGTPVPLEGYTNKVFYVWFDAPIGYISITANYTDQWQQWWKNPKKVELINFMAKDNVPFHSVIFPCSLLGADDDYTIVNHISATEYLNYEDGKFSKSRGVGVFGNDVKNTGIPADIWRFYLLYVRPESQDSTFSWDDLVLKNNSELLNNLGNFINRSLMFLSNNFKGEIPAMDFSEEDKKLLALVNRELQAYTENLEKIKIRDAIRNILNISRAGNQYIQGNQPWVKVKGSDKDKAQAGNVIGLAANISCLLSVMLQPYMPETSKTIQSQLNAPDNINVLQEKFICLLKTGHKIGKPKPLFQKIDPQSVEELRKKYGGTQTKTKTQNAIPATPGGNPKEVERLTAEVAKQGDVVRQLKAAKAEKSLITTEVNKLLALKKQLADAQAPTNAVSAPAPAPVSVNPKEVERLTEEVTKQGDKVRKLKTDKAEKATIDAEVAQLLTLKRQLALAKGENPYQQPAGGAGKKKKGGNKK